jgi:DNA polymerase (family 10)
MDSRTAAHTLMQIAEFLELAGTDRYRSRAYRSAAKAVLDLATDDIRPLVASGELQKVKGIGPSTFSVLEELAETGRSSYLEKLSSEAPAGLLELLRVPGLGLSKIRQIHDALGIDSVDELERAANDGRLARLKGFGPRTAEKIARSIANLRAAGNAVVYPAAAMEAARLLTAIRTHPDVVRAEVAGSIRRRLEIARDVDIVAACEGDPREVATAFARSPGVRQVDGLGSASLTISFVDGARLDLFCVTPGAFAVAWWRATGAPAQIEDVVE